jgi:hypothetical protein
MGGVARRGVYPHGVVCGLMMSMLTYLWWGQDLPVPLFAAVLCTPYCAVPGYLFARRHGAVWFGVLAALVTAATAHVIVFVASVGIAATTDPWPEALLWLLGIGFVPVTAFLGLFFGRLGAALVAA